MPDLIAQPESPFQADDLVQREPRLRERLALLLAREVVSGRLAAAAAFPSTEELVARFEVSRTVAREALQTLFMLGLVRVQHGKRTEVLPMASWDILSSVVRRSAARGAAGCADHSGHVRISAPDRAARRGLDVRAWNAGGDCRASRPCRADGLRGGAR